MDLQLFSACCLLLFFEGKLVEFSIFYQNTLIFQWSIIILGIKSRIYALVLIDKNCLWFFFKVQTNRMVIHLVHIRYAAESSQTLNIGLFSADFECFSQWHFCWWLQEILETEKKRGKKRLWHVFTWIRVGKINCI